jgi:hypothetical protein
VMPTSSGCRSERASTAADLSDETGWQPGEIGPADELASSWFGASLYKIGTTDASAPGGEAVRASEGPETAQTLHGRTRKTGSAGASTSSPSRATGASKTR